ncbi:MAG: response regulator transcription factor [Acidobacteriaceae bacterium]
MDDDGATRQGRIGLLNFEPIRVAGFREILERGNYAVAAGQLPNLLKEAEFDLLMVALRDRELTRELLTNLKSWQPRVRVMVVSPQADDETILCMISGGAKGWLDDAATPDQVLQAVSTVLRGSIWAPRRILCMVVNRVVDGTRPAFGPRTRFTEREQDVLRQLVLARSNREIAQALSIREQTVKSYIARMMRKVGVDNRIALSLRVADGGEAFTKESEG